MSGNISKARSPERGDDQHKSDVSDLNHDMEGVGQVTDSGWEGEGTRTVPSLDGNATNIEYARSLEECSSSSSSYKDEEDENGGLGAPVNEEFPMLFLDHENHRLVEYFESTGMMRYWNKETHQYVGFFSQMIEDTIKNRQRQPIEFENGENETDDGSNGLEDELNDHELLAFSIILD